MFGQKWWPSGLSVEKKFTDRTHRTSACGTLNGQVGSRKAALTGDGFGDLVVGRLRYAASKETAGGQEFGVQQGRTGGAAYQIVRK
jgi:hypothetical protein